MQAIVFRQINELPSLQEIDIPMSEIEVFMLCAAFNHRDLWITKGLYPGLKANTIMGADGVGMVDGHRYFIKPGLSWGNNEAYQSPQYRVLGVPDHGTFATYHYTTLDNLYPVPTYLSDTEAAALPVAGVTAYRALFSKCQLKKGEKVLITGIGGGVALMAGLMAQAIGAEVFFTSGDDDKIRKAMALGFKYGVNYKNENWVEELSSNAGLMDVIIDSAGGDAFASLVKLCQYGARMAFYGASTGKINGLNPQSIFWKQISIFGSTMGSDNDFKHMIQLIDQYQIKPVVYEILPFEKYQRGFEILASASQFGKVCLQISQ